MCLAIPLKVTKTNGSLAEVKIADVQRQVDIRFLEKVKIGDYILVHAGFAIEKIDKNQARETLKIFKNIIDKQ